MKQPIPHNGTAPLRAGDRVQIVPDWQDPGDAQYERLVIETPPDSTRVLVQTHIPGFQIQPVEWIEAAKLIHLPPTTKQPTTPI
jgi:hypothetical protein